MNNKGFGALGEAIAEKYLKKQGYKILATNCKFGLGELDIVAIEPVKLQKKLIKEQFKEQNDNSVWDLRCRLSALNDILVFIEVKYSSSKKFGEPYERIDISKQKHIIKAGEMFMYKNHMFNMPCRFDVISVMGDKVEHLKNAFETH